MPIHTHPSGKDVKTVPDYEVRGSGSVCGSALYDRLYEHFDFRSRTAQDPIKFPMSYRAKEDIEAAGLIASSFAYGRIELFMPVIDRVLAPMGQSPSGFLMDFDAKKKGRLFSGIRYRFNKTDDILALVHVIGHLMRQESGIEGAFMRFYRKDDPDTGEALIGFVDYVLGLDTSAVYGKDVRPPGFLQFFPSPRGGGACKRLNLFLRWMVRDTDIDFGLWKGIPKSRLVIPLDTHIARLGRKLGLTARKSNDWRTAVEITDSLRKLDPRDPLKYDFALCHAGKCMKDLDCVVSVASGASD